jgi:hypothetical protein
MMPAAPEPQAPSCELAGGPDLYAPIRSRDPPGGMRVWERSITGEAAKPRLPASLRASEPTRPVGGHSDIGSA